MNQYSDDAFDNVIKGYDQSPYQQTSAPMHGQGPYGIPANSIPTKPGLTKRGKVAIAIGTAVLATGGLIFWQHSNAVEAASQEKAQEIQLENKKLDLQMLQAMNQANASTQKQQNTAEQERQKQISACVNTDKGLVGKQMGVTYSSVLKDCQSQFPASTDGGDMQNTASSKDAGSGSGGVNDGLLIGGAVLVGGILLVVRRNTRSNQA